MKSTESDILRAICDYLALRSKSQGYLFWRSNNIPVFSKGNFRAMPKYAMLGVPDINLIHNGQFIGIEVKTGTGRLSEHQIAFGRLCKEAGAEYMVMRSVDDLIQQGL